MVEFVDVTCAWLGGAHVDSRMGRSPSWCNAQVGPRGDVAEPQPPRSYGTLKSAATVLADTETA